MGRRIGLISIFVLVATAVFGGAGTVSAAGPNPRSVYVQSISYGGTGCPQGSVGQSISDDRTAFTLIFDSFVASSGPGVPLTESSKNCQVKLNLHIPQGWSFTIASFDYRGYVQLPAGTTATLRSTYSFDGTRSQPSLAHFAGPVAKDYQVHDKVGLPTLIWSACNAVAPLNVSSQVRINNPSGQPAQITTDSIDGKTTTLIRIQWRRC